VDTVRPGVEPKSFLGTLGSLKLALYPVERRLKVTIRELAVRLNMSLREIVLKYLTLFWFFKKPGVGPTVEILEAASQAGIDPLEIIRSCNYLDNPKHYERSN
jgi:hypothetical protein